MADLFFEVFVEELPALSVMPASRFMGDYIAEALTAKKITFGEIKTYGTPRRLVLHVDNISLKEPDVEEEVLGPKVSLAYTDAGALSPTGEGFLRSRGLSEKDAFKKITPKGEVIAATMHKEGQKTSEILTGLLPEMLRKIPFKKRMRWDLSGDTFSRPIRGMVAMLNGEYLSFGFADVKSGTTTIGHRFLSPEPFTVTSFKQYCDEMTKRFVMLSFADRKRLIIDQANQKLAAIGGKLSENEELLEMVPNLMEYPFVIVGGFEQKYLEVPAEILVSEMATHQKCFAVYDKIQCLMPNFVTVAGTKPYDDEVFAKGNARVLRARFEDGAFYFKSDKKLGIKAMAENLKMLVFERDLGSMAEKTARVECLAQALAPHFGLNEGEMSILEDASPLIKADLVSGVVQEFPELQGTMGRIYAHEAGFEKEVGQAIETHYWPRNAYDKLPNTKVAAILAMADRLDTLVGIIGQGQGPKGNKDPFGLRRAAIALVRIVVEFSLRVPVIDLVHYAVAAYPKSFQAKWGAIAPTCADFIMQRARGLLIEQLSKDDSVDVVKFVDSVLAVGNDDLVDIFARAEVLFSLGQENPAELFSLSQTFKRAGNIVKKAQESGWDEEMSLSDASFSSVSEQVLFSALKDTEKVLSAKNAQGIPRGELRDFYKNIFAGVSHIKPKLDNFFEENMVMVDDQKVRNTRLSLLLEIKTISDRIADFTHI